MLFFDVMYYEYRPIKSKKQVEFLVGTKYFIKNKYCIILDFKFMAKICQYIIVILFNNIIHCV